MSDFHHIALGAYEAQEQPAPQYTTTTGRFWVTALDQDGKEEWTAKCETPEDLHEALEDCFRNGMQHKIEWFPF